jgi:hypothetical protein
MRKHTAILAVVKWQLSGSQISGVDEQEMSNIWGKYSSYGDT